MKKRFETPSMNIATFNIENIVTGSSATDGKIIGENYLRQKSFTADTADVQAILIF